ncbi:hypothetical protein NHX12_006500 [Muraenolepis orangiensis]|uniref:Uncharacterized protein n=1 Tax=Muraenolepis orangiensis TaxID=630683 RepID=A0A9Q0DR51_9TELE|nr:hypothetical protein NHX12_006500 [Muraenolepis orangiensis]
MPPPYGSVLSETGGLGAPADAKSEEELAERVFGLRPPGARNAGPETAVIEGKEVKYKENKEQCGRESSTQQLHGGRPPVRMDERVPVWLVKGIALQGRASNSAQLVAVVKRHRGEPTNRAERESESQGMMQLGGNAIICPWFRRGI